MILDNAGEAAAAGPGARVWPPHGKGEPRKAGVSGFMLIRKLIMF